MTRTRSSRLFLFYVALGAVVATGMGIAIVRLMNGLGGTTSLSDAYPWGIWIVYDVFFVPFSAGAFMILALAHIFNLREYHAVARPVVIAGFLGEIMVVAVLVMDLGRWHQFYNVLYPGFWNVRSFMFQVSLCLTVYMAIMVLEVAPAILEKLNWQTPLRFIRPATVFIAGIGIVLAALHQTALGSLFLLMPYRVHALWWSSFLPAHFFVSAAYGGLAMAILVATLSFRAFGRQIPRQLLANLARLAAVIMGIYLLLRVTDLAVAGELSLVASSGGLSLLLLFETGAGVLLPLIMFSIRQVRETTGGLVVGAFTALSGIALNRTTVALLAQSRAAEYAYAPHWMEVFIALAAVAGGVLLFALAVHILPILPGERGEHHRPVPLVWSRRTAMVAGTGLCILTIAVVLVLQPVAQAEATRLTESSSPPEPEIPPGASCASCHLSAEALVLTGAEPARMDVLLLESLPDDEAHTRIDCVTCHHGNEAHGDIAGIHSTVITDPSVGDYGTCLACHPGLPTLFPEDRLRTPHDEYTHGGAVGVHCSDCHGAVGHGFDPVSGNVLCPMSVCLDCHAERQLEHELTDCGECHIGPHEPVTGFECASCHVSTNDWERMERYEHELELGGGHADLSCLVCHGDQEGVRNGECSSCHEPPEGGHYAPECSSCHTPGGFQSASLPAHKTELVGFHKSAPCSGCHADGESNPPTECVHCHQAPGGHLEGACGACHTPDGWLQSASFLVELSPQLAHGLEGLPDCQACHDPAGDISPAPEGHADLGSEQCTICHKGND